MLYQIIYMSRATEAQSASQIFDILRLSRSNNSRDGITGILMYYDKCFFQVVEGERRFVEACFSRIASDSRHTQVTAIWNGEVAKRTFPSWTMGTADPLKLGQQGKDSLISLAELKNDKESVMTGNSVAAKLAHWVMLDFSNVQ